MSGGGVDVGAKPDGGLMALAAAVGAGDERVTSARHDASGRLVSSGPDVRSTPQGGGDVPLAHPVVTALPTPSVRLSMGVRDDGDDDLRPASHPTAIRGHREGVAVPDHERHAHVKVVSDFAHAERFATAAHRQEAWIDSPDLGPQASRESENPEDI